MTDVFGNSAMWDLAGPILKDLLQIGKRIKLSKAICLPISIQDRPFPNRGITSSNWQKGLYFGSNVANVKEVMFGESENLKKKGCFRCVQQL
jgi:hypothetical protein